MTKSETLDTRFTTRISPAMLKFLHRTALREETTPSDVVRELINKAMSKEKK